MLPTIRSFQEEPCKEIRKEGCIECQLDCPEHKVVPGTYTGATEIAGPEAVGRAGKGVARHY